MISMTSPSNLATTAPSSRLDYGIVKHGPCGFHVPQPRMWSKLCARWELNIILIESSARHSQILSMHLGLPGLFTILPRHLIQLTTRWRSVAFHLFPGATPACQREACQGNALRWPQLYLVRTSQLPIQAPSLYMAERLHSMPQKPVSLTWDWTTKDPTLANRPLTTGPLTLTVTAIHLRPVFLGRSCPGISHLM